MTALVDLPSLTARAGAWITLLERDQQHVQAALIRDLLAYASTVSQKPASPHERAEMMLQLERLADPIRPLVAAEYRPALLAGKMALSREPALEVALATVSQERDELERHFDLIATSLESVSSAPLYMQVAELRAERDALRAKATTFVCCWNCPGQPLCLIQQRCVWPAPTAATPPQESP